MNPLIIPLFYGVIVTFGVGGIMMLWVFRRVIKEEIRAWKLRTMYRPASIKGKKRSHQIR
jgi:hypothetical protein